MSETTRSFFSTKPVLRLLGDEHEPRQKIGPKPTGVWYQCGDSWKDWASRDMPHRFAEYEHRYEIEVDLSRMLVIRTNEQLDAFDAKYQSVRVIDGERFPWIDWVAVARDYDGIEICPYLEDRRDTLYWYWDWDVAQGCVWKADVIKSIRETSMKANGHQHTEHTLPNADLQISAMLAAPKFFASLGITEDDILKIYKPSPKNRLKRIGFGFYAEALLLPDGRVLKITTDHHDAEAAELVRRAFDKGTSPRGLPRVDQVVRLGTRGETYYAIIVERVTPFRADDEAVKGLKSTLRGMVYDKVWKVEGALERLRLEGRPIPGVLTDPAMVAKFNEAMRGVKWLNTRGFQVADLHINNFGTTADGRSVLIDFGDYSRQRGPVKVAMAQNPKIVGFDVTANPVRKPTERQVLTIWRALGSPTVNMDELRMGIEVEQEHTNDLREAGKIALDHLREFDDYYTRLTKMEARAKKGLAPNSSAPMPKIRASFDRHFTDAERMFINLGTVELYEDEAAGSDNGAGADRQFGYCKDANPIVIAFAPKTEQLPRNYIDGLMAHEFGHAIEFRYGRKALETKWGKLPDSIERRADKIAEKVFGRRIEYGDKDIQCVNCDGKKSRPKRLG